MWRFLKTTLEPPEASHDPHLSRSTSENVFARAVELQDHLSFRVEDLDALQVSPRDSFSIYHDARRRHAAAVVELMVAMNN